MIYELDIWCYVQDRAPNNPNRHIYRQASYPSAELAFKDIPERYIELCLCGYITYLNNVLGCWVTPVGNGGTRRWHQATHQHYKGCRPEWGFL